MTVRVQDGIVTLEGRCPAADAESLLVALQAHPGATVDVAGAKRLHMAVLQVLLALRPPLGGIPECPAFAANILARQISNGDKAT
ncbi:MAG TPA: hypothetical protein VMQ93_01915 [Novosphingobium sp.]|nr:hypothetical protein [Novosphingobium sp.]